MADYSDNSENRINILKFLEGTTFDTDVNRSLVENTFNRFLTKDNTVESIGQVGLPNPAAIVDRQLKEDTVHRQTYQLQPLIHKRVATVDYTMSFKDLIAELTRLGVDANRLPEWANTEQFNFVPPVDLDKLINYRNYYWYDPQLEQNTPQYITIKTPCTAIAARVTQRNREIAGIGAKLPLAAIDLNTNEFAVTNTTQATFVVGSVFDVLGAPTVAGQYIVESVRVQGSTVLVKPVETIPTNLYNGGYVTFDTQIADLTADRNAVCDGSAGWGVGLWDDQSHVENGDTVTTPVQLQYLKDNNPDIFNLVIARHPTYVDSNGAITNMNSRPVWYWLGEDRPEFDITWDAQGALKPRNAWQKDNFWVHKLDLPAGKIAFSTRAEAPIIEYLSDLQLNEWTELTHKWMHRENPVRDKFQPSSIGPTDAEYSDPQFLDKWVYVGPAAVTPIEPQPENTFASVMSTNLSAVAALSSGTAKIVLSVVNKTVTLAGVFPVAVNSYVQTVNGIEVGRHKVVSAVGAANNTVITLATTPALTAGNIVVVPTTATINTVIFPPNKQQVAFAGSNAARVYVDGEQVAGTYTELTVRAGTQYYVAGIQLDVAVSTELTVDVGIDPAALSDRYRSVWSVRTPSHMDDKQYEDDGRPTVAVCMLSYFKQQQTKNPGEQKFPTFDLFYPSGVTARQANSIFSYVTNSSAKLNKHTNLRLKTSSNGTVFHFNQLLIEEDNGSMLCYKDLESITSENPTGLQSIWRTEPGATYVPKFVDVNRRVDGEKWFDAKNVEQTAVVDTTNGDWEIIDQLVFNASHENKREINSTQLSEHVKTINLGQETVEGFLPSPYGFRLHPTLDYSIGGTIKEHNGSFDTLASAIFVAGSNPPAVIAYAKTAYESALSSLADYIVSNAYTFLTDSSQDVIADLQTIVTQQAIELYETNDSNNVIFGDSVTYANGLGVKNWPATIPFLGLGPLHRPTQLTDHERGIYDIIHHDGHRGTYSVSTADAIAIARRIVKTVYKHELITRYRGWTPSQAADKGTLHASYTTIPWTRLRPIDIWVNGQTFKRFNVIDISAVAPSLSIPDGTMWLRNTDGQLMHKVTTSGAPSWEPVSTPGDVSAAWQDVNLSNMLNSIIMEVETRLYQSAAAQNIPSCLDHSLFIRNNTTDPILYDSLREGNFNQFVRDRSIFAPYASVYKTTDPFTWNYSGVDVQLQNVPGVYANVWNPNTNNAPVAWAGYWAGIYTKVYGTALPHLEPWVLQGFNTRPEWWNEWYADTTGTRRWNPQMWTNVLSNRVPAQFSAPAPVLYSEVDGLSGIEYKVMTKRFAYVPVNIARPIISNSTVLYKLDDLFPPYDSRMFAPENLDVVSGSSIGKPMIRVPSAISNVNLRATYVFGDLSPIEWEWAKSTVAPYHTIEAAFLMQPIRFMDSTWGTKFNNVGGLRIDADTGKVFNHKNTIFHGDVVDGQTYKAFGLNQWYVNFNRSSGLDFKVSNFREMWTNWDTKLAYQFGCYINTKSLDAASAAYDMIREDFNIIAKKSPGYQSLRVDSLQLKVANYGEYSTRDGLRIPSGDGSTWSFLIDVPSTSATSAIEYYGVRNLQYEVVDTATGTLRVVGGNLPWIDGTEVEISSSKYAPYPLDPSWTYYIEVVDIDLRHFRLHRKKSDSFDKKPTLLRTEGTGVQTVREVQSTFATAVDTQANIWTHTVINKNEVIHTKAPMIIQGIQNVIDFVDGYAARLEDRGIRVNHNASRELDTETGRLVSWQTELERAIVKIYSGVGKNNTPIKQYGTTIEYVVTNPTDAIDTFATLNDIEFPFQLGQEVYMFSAGATPTGITLNTAYYAIPVDSTNFKLATTAENAFAGIGINVLSEGIGKQYIGAFPSAFVVGDEYVEINPFRNNIWIHTATGMVSNVFDGGYTDVNNEVTIYDQYGRPLPRGSLVTLREDKLTRVTVRPGIANDVITGATDSYNNIHIGGVKFYLDGYEHAVLFNNYTTDGYLVYDPFIGMDVSRLNVSFNRSSAKPLRPSLGGYYYDNGEMVRNLESSVVDMRSYYDTYGGTTASDFVGFARALLGYEDPTYLDQLNTQERAKFLFWKGMIQHKGSKAAINAFINSKHFVDARIDEFWAYKVADFGDARQKYKPEIKVMVNDGYGSDLRYEFLETGTSGSDRFVSVSYASADRWVDPLKVKQEMNNDPLYFDADLVTDRAVFQTIGADKYITISTRLDGVKVEYKNANGDWIKWSVAGGQLIQVNDRAFKIIPSLPVGIIEYYVTGYTPALNKLDPIQFVDTGNNTIVYTSKVWDPLNGVHYYAPLRDITHMSDIDPASYSTVDGNGDTAVSPSWTSTHIGDVWVDTSTIGYVPYNDATIFPEMNDRLARWGRLAGWSQPTAYEWVRSSKNPAEYEAAGASEEGNTSIPIADRASGMPRKFIRRISTGAEVSLHPHHVLLDVAGSISTLQGAPEYQGLDVHAYVNGTFVTQRPLEDLVFSDLVGYTMGDYVTFDLKIPAGSSEFEEDYRSLQITESDINGVDSTVYYFWSANRNIADSDKMSAAQISAQIAYPSAPYHIYLNFNDGVGGDPRYNQVIVRGVAQKVNDDNRYVLRFTRDFTLRDKLSSGRSAMDLKNKHAEWIMFRQKQPYKISESLWNMLVEALVGYQLTGFDDGMRVPVPSLSRVIHDEQFNTTTRFGLEPGQAFADKETGLATILALLQSANFNTAPIDKHVFLELYTFDTPVNIKRSLQYIFTNFSDASVNRAFFEVMHDALSAKQDFAGLFMTSFVALHGIKILETSGSVA